MTHSLGGLVPSEKGGATVSSSDSGPKKTRQRPTLPQSRPCSTIGPGGLNFRVRDGNGCGPSGIAAGKLRNTKANCLDVPLSA